MLISKIVSDKAGMVSIFWQPLTSTESYFGLATFLLSPRSSKPSLLRRRFALI